MSDFVYQPLNGANVTQTPKVLAAVFGDGYEQRAADGINTMAETHSVTFRNTKAVIDSIKNFFESKKGAEAFTWTPAGDNEIKVVCPSWSKVRISKKHAEISATFRQVFE